MKLYHVSEAADIFLFTPRILSRLDLDQQTGLVWAIDEAHLPNYLTPRECPRVTYHVGKQTTQQDRQSFFSSSTMTHAVVIEQAWFSRMANTTLYLYEMDPTNFELIDEIAGYYVSKQSEKPLSKTQVDDLFEALLMRNVELRIVDRLGDLCSRVQRSSLNWSMIKMSNAQKEV